MIKRQIEIPGPKTRLSAAVDLRGEVGGPYWHYEIRNPSGRLVDTAGPFHNMEEAARNATQMITHLEG